MEVVMVYKPTSNWGEPVLAIGTYSSIDSMCNLIKIASYNL